MLSSTARSARRRRLVVKRRLLLRGVAAGSMAAGVLAVPVALAPVQVAQAADACLTPSVKDFMITQGLPSYGKLVAGKTALVKYFLGTPDCLPTGATVQVVSGSVTVNGNSFGIDTSGVLPLPPIGPASTAPVASAGSDPLFVVPGSAIAPTGADGSIAFSARLDFVAKPASGPTQSGRLEFSSVAGRAVRALVDAPGTPLRVGVFPMGDAGTDTSQTRYSTQFDDSDATRLQDTMNALHATLPVSDGVGSTRDASGGLRWSMSAGLIDLGSHKDPENPSGPEVSFITPGQPYCGRVSHFVYLQQELNTARTNWNSMNPAAPIDVAYGAVSERISTGELTGGTKGCIEGYADVAGTAAWGRLIGPVAPTATSPGRPAIGGAIARMEVGHLVGTVAAEDPRSDSGFHSKNVEADGTAPQRAWDVAARKYIADDRSALKFGVTGWNDATTLYEKADWDLFQCRLSLTASVRCPAPGSLGRSAAGSGSGAFFLSGSTDGTKAGTDASTYLDDDRNYERPDPTSKYFFVQRSATRILRADGFRVTSAGSHHHGANPGAGQVHTHRGTFGTEFEADPETVRIQIVKGDPFDAKSPVLYDRLRNARPEFRAISVEGRTVTVSATDETPADLRLDLFYECPDVVSPLVNAAKPVVAGPLAVFTASYDTSLGCSDGRLLFRLHDGYLVNVQPGAVEEVQEGAGEAVAGLQPAASITTPRLGDTLTPTRVIGLTGSARDAAGKNLTDLRWRLQGPGAPAEPIATGQQATYVPPAGGLLPGTYTLELLAYDGGPQPVARASRTMVIQPDEDLDLLPDPEPEPCYPAGAAKDPTNAVLDSDRDGEANVDDALPCDPSNGGVRKLLTVKTQPTSLQKGSSGTPVSVQITGSEIDLRTLTPTDLRIVKIAGFSTDIAPYAVTVDGPTTAQLKFDRGLVNQFLRDKELLGYIPFFIGTVDGSVRGVDPTSPRVFP